MSSPFLQCCGVLLSITLAVHATTTASSTATSVILHLPNTSLVDGQLTANLGVDHFFSLWIVFNNDEVVISDEPFTILAPKNTAIIKDNGVLQQPESVKRLLSDHVVLGARIDLNNTSTSTSSSSPSPTTSTSRSTSPPPPLPSTTSSTTPPATTERTYVTLGGRNFTLTYKEGRWRANGANILETRPIQPNGLLVVLDDYIFADELQKKSDNEPKVVKPQERNEESEKRPKPGSISNKTTNNVRPSNLQVVVGGNGGNGDGRNVSEVVAIKEETKAIRNVTFIENVMQVLSLLKSGVRVFQHFLSRSNVSKLLNDEDEYTVFVPTDHAFQRWHPIDWGFYPFSVPEFTESVIINHFVRGKLKQDGIRTEQTAKTLGGKEVVFRKAPNLTVNGASVVKGDTPLPKGNIMFISEVLFVSESVVSRLHQQHRDKETPPLLAFPWFGAQFLSHAFLALERDRRFTHITRFLNLADLAPHVSGTGYTFFVPTDTAFEEIGLDKMPDNYLSTGDGLEILLNHFVKGRLYDRDLKDNLTLTTLGNKAIVITRRKENVTVNKAQIVESEVFVYNLGTMFYIDKVLFAKPELLPKIRRPTTTTTTTTTMATTTIATQTTEPPTSTADSVNEGDKQGNTSIIDATTPQMDVDVESVPEELSESGGSMPDVLFADAESQDNNTTVEEIHEAATTTTSTTPEAARPGPAVTQLPSALETTIVVQQASQLNGTTTGTKATSASTTTTTRTTTTTVGSVTVV